MRSLRFGFTLMASVVVGVGVLLGAIAMMMAISTTVRSASIPAVPQPGAAAPDFELHDLNGRKVHLADYRGKPAILVFWADWCPHCREMIPEFNRMAAEGIPIVSVNLLEEPERVQRAVEMQGIEYPVALDIDGEVGRAYGVEAIPNVFLIDESGNVVHNELTSPELVKKLQSRFHSIAR
jgi:peroxiredoxin